MFALIGGVRVDDFTLSRDGSNFDGTTRSGQPFTKNWNAGILSRGLYVRAGQGT